MTLKEPKKIKYMIGKEYEVQGRFATLEAIEGTMFPEGVFRDRWDNVFRCEMGYVKEKKRIRKNG